ncbi:hypothetical protein Pelo_1504 [Pelomyxa schiedti]|nr:hypothetical protein Pelo_1504 [Pelomyxa schiedti]
MVPWCLALVLIVLSVSLAAETTLTESVDQLSRSLNEAETVLEEIRAHRTVAQERSEQAQREAAQMLEAAQRFFTEARETLENAKAEASTIRKEAREEAGNLTAEASKALDDAKLVASTIRQDALAAAQLGSAKIMEEAQGSLTEARKALEEAKSVASTIRQEAREEAQNLRAEASKALEDANLEASRQKLDALTKSQEVRDMLTAVTLEVENHRLKILKGYTEFRNEIDNVGTKADEMIRQASRIRWLMVLTVVFGLIAIPRICWWCFELCLGWYHRRQRTSKAVMRERKYY